MVRGRTLIQPTMGAAVPACVVDQSRVALDTAHLAVDVETFLVDWRVTAP